MHIAIVVQWLGGVNRRKGKKKPIIISIISNHLSFMLRDNE
jgi:hypothetical protein